MFNSFGYTWNAMKASMGVLRKDGELLVFPIISGLLCLLVTASFFGPVLLGEGAAEPSARTGAVEEGMLYVLIFAFYFVTYFVIYFFNAAVIGCAVMRMRGRDPTVKDGFRIALSRLPQLIGWAAVSATVGLILRMLERHKAVGGIVSAVLGAAFSLLTYLAVPILVVEGKGPIDSAKESASLLKKTWGSQLAGQASFGLIGFIGLIFIGLATLALVLAFGPSSLPLIGPLAVISAIMLFIVISALGTIFQAALYLYVTEDKSPEGFEGEMLSGAMHQAA